MSKLRQYKNIYTGKVVVIPNPCPVVNEYFLKKINDFYLVNKYVEQKQFDTKQLCEDCPLKMAFNCKEQNCEGVHSIEGHSLAINFSSEYFNGEKNV